MLLHPIAVDPSMPGSSSPQWEQEHGTKKRFILGGADWFINNTGLNANRVSAYRELGLERFNELARSGAINWRKMPGLQSDPTRYWRDISRQQINRAFNGEPVYLSKLMMIFICCEVAVEESIRRTWEMPNIFEPHVTAPEDIYQFMSAIPVCWNVNKFNPQNLKAAEAADEGFRADLAKACGQKDSSPVFDQLASGATVTYGTAKAVYDHCSRKDVDFSEKDRMEVRVTEGTYLGTKHAAVGETIDRG
ncbi:MAG: hypothetical protein AAFR64_03470 [Pseudomonadota bacterium]